jgi:drug/metabolite transporter (DMT)-like permease
MYALYVLVIAEAGREAGWLAALVPSRIVATAITISVAIVVVGRRRTESNIRLSLPGLVGWDRTILLGIIAVGMLSTLGQVFLAYGLTYSTAWLVALLAGMSPVIVVLAGYWLVHERLRRTQLLGLLLTGSGLVALAIA